MPSGSVLPFMSWPEQGLRMLQHADRYRVNIKRDIYVKLSMELHSWLFINMSWGVNIS